MNLAQAFTRAMEFERPFSAGRVKTKWLDNRMFEGHKVGIEVFERTLPTRWYIRAYFDGTILLHKSNFWQIRRYAIRRNIERHIEFIATLISEHDGIEIWRRKPITHTESPISASFWEHVENKYELEAV